MQRFLKLPNLCRSLQAHANLLIVASSTVCLEPRPLSSPGITRAPWYYGPLRHPNRPDSDPHGSTVVRSRHSHRLGLPVLHRSSMCMHAVATTPAELSGAHVARLPDSGGLPRISAGSASALPFSRPARRSLALRPAYSLSPLRTRFTKGFDRFVASTTAPAATGRSDSYRVGVSPTERPCLCTAH